MPSNRLLRASVLLLLAPTASAQFVEPEVSLIRQHFSPTGSFGWAVSELRDTNGDGVQEVLIGAPFSSANRGLVRVHSGADGAILHNITGVVAGELLGWSVADAGDVNNDGFNDFLAGGIGGSGVVRVFSGNPADASAEILTVPGPGAGSQFGYAVSSLEDTNSDGHADLLIGAPGEATGGRVHIVSGADGSNLHTIIGPNVGGALFGQGVAGVGDIDNDGVSDGAAGAPGAGTAVAFSGADGSVIHAALNAEPGNATFGQFFVGRCGDVDADGTPDIYIGDYSANGGVGKIYVFSGIDGSVVHAIPGDGAGQGLGPGRGMLADIDHDGHDDLVVGSYSSSDGSPNGGKIDVLSGRTGAKIRTITSTLQQIQLGFDCVGAGDLNGDGTPDIIGSAANGNRVFIIEGIPICPGDLTTTGGADPGVPDGTVDLSDLLFFVNVWQVDIGTPTPNPGSIADVTTTGGGNPGVPDGNVDLSDLLYYVNDWQSGLAACP